MENQEVKYRVIESLGVFFIQIYAPITSGMLWWKKTKWDWHLCADGGYPYIGLVAEYFPLPKAFNSLEEATERIKLFKAKPIIHEINL